MSEDFTPSFGGRARIRSNVATEARGFAGRMGIVSGFTTPSVTGIQVIGAPLEDFALAVMFEEPPTGDAWFTRDLVEFIDHAPGTEIRVGNARAVRREDGSWEETLVDGSPVPSSPHPRRRRWQFWKRG